MVVIPHTGVAVRKMMYNLQITLYPRLPHFGQVEREVDLDSRIRRVYLSMRGQRNVPCWEWLSPITNYEVIGVRLAVVAMSMLPLLLSPLTKPA